MTGRLFEWPLIVIDFEASALETDAFPIEVGIAIADTRTSEPVVWSTLIKPEPSWNMDQKWDPDAQRLHRIKRWDLSKGLTARKAMDGLNERLPEGATVWCDGGYYDQVWLATLAKAADIVTSFTLRDVTSILHSEPKIQRDYAAYLTETKPPHRAGPDAKRIIKALCRLSG